MENKCYSNSKKRIHKQLKKNQTLSRKYFRLLKKHSFNQEVSKLDQILKRNNEFESFLNQLESLKAVPEVLLNLKDFKGYRTCQLLVHEKGKSNIISYNYDTQIGKTTTEHPVNFFNSVYNIIKKSKLKLFEQSKIPQNDISILGTFLAKEFDLKAHRIIYIISRNDFLPSTEDERLSFDNLCYVLGPLFTHLLNRKKILDRKKNIILALNNIPSPAIIIDKKTNINFFTNRLYQENEVQIQSDDLYSPSPMPLSNNYELVLFFSRNEILTPDIHQFLRIQLLGELLNTLSHELSNPLFGLKLATELLIANTSNCEHKETLEEVSNNCIRCQKIIHNFSGLYSDKPVFVKIDIREIIREVLTVTKSETQHITKEIISSKCDDLLFIVNTNPTWVAQIIFNFIINSSQAIKSASNDLFKTFIHTSIEPDECSITISVTDNGPGIDSSVLDKVSMPFITTKQKGTGLGLAICQSLAKKLGGEITFFNNPDRAGATFSLILHRK
ncbi:MAG: HAMP domain-containing histidine kinase [Bacteriovoracaceae bacterium]|nr:HAMP domain-containing histidine kinase [Bacteriovoracaceae bacterium]